MSVPPPQKPRPFLSGAASMRTAVVHPLSAARWLLLLILNYTTPFRHAFVEDVCFQLGGLQSHSCAIAGRSTGLPLKVPAVAYTKVILLTPVAALIWAWMGMPGEPGMQSVAVIKRAIALELTFVFAIELRCKGIGSLQALPAACGCGE